MAEREGFEPSVPFPVHILSRDAQSATLSSLLVSERQKKNPDDSFGSTEKKPSGTIQAVRINSLEWRAG